MRMNNKDWSGNKRSVYTTLGTNHNETEREHNDFYATDPKAMELLLDQETFSNNIWECACGAGHLSRILESHGYNVLSTDLIYRGYGLEKSVDFLKDDFPTYNGDIITNPPYKYALEFIQKALDMIPRGHKVAMFLKLQFLEGKRRKGFFLKNPPKTIYVSSSRIQCAMNGEFEKYGSSAVAYAWYIWVKGHKGDPVIKWMN